MYFPHLHIQIVLEAAEPQIWALFLQSGQHPCHAASAWLSNCFYGFLVASEAGKAMALAVALGPDYLVYCCAAILKHLEPELSRSDEDHGGLLVMERCTLCELRDEGLA